MKYEWNPENDHRWSKPIETIVSVGNHTNYTMHVFSFRPFLSFVRKLIHVSSRLMITHIMTMVVTLYCQMALSNWGWTWWNFWQKFFSFWDLLHLLKRWCCMINSTIFVSNNTTYYSDFESLILSTRLMKMCL